jgi:hypothetical protein
MASFSQVYSENCEQNADPQSRSVFPRAGITSVEENQPCGGRLN